MSYAFTVKSEVIVVSLEQIKMLNSNSSSSVTRQIKKTGYYKVGLNPNINPYT